MPAAADTQLPVGSGGGGGEPSRDPTSDKPMFNSWTENKKIKTCKCTVCDGRVRASSQKCNGCGRHVCSDCLDPDSDKDPYYKATAKNRMEVGCWACNWRSNMNPAFARRKPAPEVRTEEERRAKASKALGARRKATAKASRPKSNVTPKDEATGDLFVPSTDSARGVGTAEDSAVQPSGSSVRPISQRIGCKRKRNIEEPSHVESIQGSSRVESHTEVARQLEQWSSSNSFAKVTTHSSSSTATKDTRIPAISPLTPAADMSAFSSKGEHLENASTVIVGAGVVGLFIAYELASKVQELRINHNITVVEINSDKFSLASGACAGLLNTSGMPQLWREKIGEVALPYWRELFAKRDFSRDVSLGDTSLTSLADEDYDETIETSKPPSWYWSKTSHRDLIRDSDTFGRIDPENLGAWLFQQCKELGVRFMFKHAVGRCDWGTHYHLKHVYVQKSDKKEIRLDCNNLVLAAGPFTTGIFNELFDRKAVEIENNVQGNHTLHVLLHGVIDSDFTVLRLPEAAKDVESLENEVKMALHPPVSTLKVSAISTNTVGRHLEPCNAREPGKAKTADLREVAAKYLNHAGVDVTDRAKYPQTEGSRLELCTANGGNPIIDKVPASALGFIVPGQEDSMNPRGVWLCYGFGRYGTTLAPGAARLLVSKMFEAGNFGGGDVDGDDEDDEDSEEGEAASPKGDFSLPSYEKPMPGDLEGGEASA